MITVVLASSLSILAGIGFNFIRSRIPALILFLSGQAAIGLAWYLAIVTTHPEIAEEQPFSIPTLFAWWFAFIFAPGAIGFGVTSLARDFLRKKRGDRAALLRFSIGLRGTQTRHSTARWDNTPHRSIIRASKSLPSPHIPIVKWSSGVHLTQSIQLEKSCNAQTLRDSSPGILL